MDKFNKNTVVVFLCTLFTFYGFVKDFFPFKFQLNMTLDFWVKLVYNLAIGYFLYDIYTQLGRKQKQTPPINEAIERLQQLTDIINLQGKLRLYNQNKTFINGPEVQINSITRGELEAEKIQVKKQLLQNPNFKHFTKQDIDALIEHLYS